VDETAPIWTAAPPEEVALGSGMDGFLISTGGATLGAGAGFTGAGAAFAGGGAGFAAGGGDITAGAGFAGFRAWAVAAGAAGMLTLAACRKFVYVSAAQYVPLGELTFWSLLATAPLGLLVGGVFPLACLILREEAEASRVYALDALGGLAGADLDHAVACGAQGVALRRGAWPA
jgi:hypothetical protein